MKELRKGLSSDNNTKEDIKKPTTPTQKDSDKPND